MFISDPFSVTHLHNDTIPKIGGDTLWASGYAAYEKLSPAFRKIIDGREAVYRSAHPYLDRDDTSAGPKHIERVHPIVRVHPATGWKALWVNRAFTDRIVGLDKAESDVIEPRHGTRVTSLAEKPYFKADAPTRRQALGLAGPEDV